MLKEFIEYKVNPVLRRFGGAIVPTDKEASPPAVMRRLRKKSIDVETVIDVGASYGKWTEVVMDYYPQAKYLLIDLHQMLLSPPMPATIARFSGKAVHPISSIIEVYNFVVADRAIRFHEMISFFENRVFRVADMCDPVFRSSDGILWQMDLPSFVRMKARLPTTISEPPRR